MFVSIFPPVHHSFSRLDHTDFSEGRALDAVGCCTNDKYCIVDGQGNGACCPIGQSCTNDACGSAQVLCIQTITSTSTNTGASVATPAPVTTTFTTTQCCVRPCAQTMHLCDQKFGGFCCGNDAVCLPSKMCKATPNPNTPTLTSTLVSTTATTQLCSTGSFECALAAGGGCCPTNMICTEINNVAGCAPAGVTSISTRVIFTSVQSNSATGKLNTGTNSPTKTGKEGQTNTPTGNADGGSGGLNSGAKAGIGAGIGVGVVVLGALAAFLIMKKRKAKTTAAPITPGYPPHPIPQDPNAYYNHGMTQQAPYYPGSPPPIAGYYIPGDTLKSNNGLVAPPPAAEQPGGAVMLENTSPSQPAELPSGPDYTPPRPAA